MKQLSIEIKWAIIFFFLILLWTFGEKSFGLYGEHIEDHAFYTNFFGLVAVGVYVLALLEKRKKFYGGAMSWKQGFFTGLKLSLLIALLSPLSQWLATDVIAPEYFPNMIVHSSESGKMTLEEAESFFNTGSYIVQSLIFALISGIITSAIVALILRKKNASSVVKDPDLTAL